MLRKGVVAIPNSRVSPEAAVSNTDPQEEPKTMLLSDKHSHYPKVTYWCTIQGENLTSVGRGTEAWLNAKASEMFFQVFTAYPLPTAGFALEIQLLGERDNLPGMSGVNLANQ